VFGIWCLDFPWGVGIPFAVGGESMTIAENVARVRGAMEAAAEEAGRDPGESDW